MCGKNKLFPGNPGKLSYLGEALSKAGSSIQKLKYFLTHGSASLSCISRGQHPQRDTLVPCDSRLFTPVPQIPTGLGVPLIHTKLSGLCAGTVPRRIRTKVSGVLPVCLSIFVCVTVRACLCVCYKWRTVIQSKSTSGLFYRTKKDTGEEIPGA